MAQTIHLHGFTNEGDGSQAYCDDHAKADGFTVYARTALGGGVLDVTHSEDFATLSEARAYAKGLAVGMGLESDDVNED